MWACRDKEGGAIVGQHCTLGSIRGACPANPRPFSHGPTASHRPSAACACCQNRGTFTPAAQPQLQRVSQLMQLPASPR